MTTKALPLTKEEVLKKLITHASDSLVFDVYARIQGDRRAGGLQWSRPGGLKSWTQLVSEAVWEGALTIEEAALFLMEVNR